MDHYSKSNLLVIAYERLIDGEYGADEAMRVAEFLDRSEGVVSFPPEDVPCVWRKIVKTKEGIFNPRRLEEVNVTTDGETGDNTNFGPQDALTPNGGVAVDVDVAVVAESVVTGTALVEKQGAVGAAKDKIVMEEYIKHRKESQISVTPVKIDTIDANSAQIIETKYIAPFNKRQLRDLIQILTQLLERYRDDRGLAPILVSYIDEVSQRSQIT